MWLRPESQREGARVCWVCDIWELPTPPVDVQMLLIKLLNKDEQHGDRPAQTKRLNSCSPRSDKLREHGSDLLRTHIAQPANGDCWKKDRVRTVVKTLCVQHHVANLLILLNLNLTRYVPMRSQNLFLKGLRPRQPQYSISNTQKILRKHKTSTCKKLFQHSDRQTLKAQKQNTQFLLTE